MNVLHAEKYSLDSKFFDIFDDDFSPDDDADKLYRTLKGKNNFIFLCVYYFIVKIK